MALSPGCGPKPAETGGDSDGSSSGESTGGGTTTGGTTTTAGIPTTSSATGTGTGTSGETTVAKPDVPDDTTGEPLGCNGPGGCHRLDVLLVVDNSGPMANKQKSFTAALPHLVDRLRNLVDGEGAPIVPDVHVMVTTTDVGHLLCTNFEKPDYDPAEGAPIASACADRLPRFTGLGANPEQREDVCLDHCPVDAIAVPADPFVAFAGELNNVVGDDGMGDPVADALKCIVPQGIDGCGMEAPLEAMRLALDPSAAWNGDNGFLRPDAALAIVILTDETDCSVLDSKYFDPKLKDDPEFNKFWPDLPGMPGVKGEPTSAVCWNAGMTCEPPDANGVYPSCAPEDKGVLIPLSEYVTLLRDELTGAQGKPVVMLAVSGLPDTGIGDLVYRKWRESDIFPADTDTFQQKEYDIGIGPGCNIEGFGSASPPGRTRELCQALDVADDPNTPEDEARTRCCFQSACSADMSAGFDCLAEALSHTLKPAP